MMTHHHNWDPHPTRRLTSLIKDPATNLYLPERLPALLKEHLRVARQAGHALSLMVVRLDELDVLAANKGPAEAERVLKEMAQFLESEKRARDLPVRDRGFRLAIILPETREDKSSNLAQRICEQATSFLPTFTNEHSEFVAVSVSIGVAGYPDSGYSEDQLLTRAHNAQMHARTLGPNRFKLAAELPPSY